MTARERLAPLAARLRAALADEKQRVNLLVCMGLAGLLLLAVSSWLPADSSTQSAAPSAIPFLNDACRRPPHVVSNPNAS